ncbi:MAG: xanthine dehydrogenase family protein subunit M [Gammaproteobacteria bacterium]|nr:xanthine dehydrogenase family protein subunit M [Gammaproteobacteria bacterium]MYH16796.1 xanthine dehydrogenase family protein subunit M [Gammaproteobacteria bacterium]MYK81727.1 xanthine dehydrogenase family protein subunit M [Gammaproteobacteria bacterium]
MIAERFDYQSPTRLADALRLLAADPDGTRPLSGGMTLVPMMTLGLAAPEHIVDLKRIPELGGIHEEPDAVRIGATATHHDIATDPRVRLHAPLLADAAALVGDVQVRNRGTIGGSIAHADPAANYLPALLALDAVIEARAKRGGLLRNATRSRRIPIGEFFAGLMATCLAAGEIVAAVHVPKQLAATHQGAAFRKFARVKGNFPIVCAAALVERQSSGERAGCVAIGGALPIPVRIALPGGQAAWAAGEVETAIRQAIDDPMSDANASADYRLEMAAVHGARAVEAACRALDDGERSA